MGETKHCPICGRPAPGARVYCSNECRRRAAYAPEPGTKLASATRGSVSELLAAASFMSRGLHVFRALSPACPCDLIAMAPDGSGVTRIEVRSARRLRGGTISFAHKPSDRARADLYALVYPDGNVECFSTQAMTPVPSQVVASTKVTAGVVEPQPRPVPARFGFEHCGACGASLAGRRRDTKHCSASCRAAARRTRLGLPAWAGPKPVA
jgi:predicted nucleic acid-binding Zn ribbon protein